MEVTDDLNTIAVVTDWAVFGSNMDVFEDVLVVDPSLFVDREFWVIRYESNVSVLIALYSDIEDWLAIDLYFGRTVVLASFRLFHVTEILTVLFEVE